MPRPERSEKDLAFARKVRERLRAQYLSGAEGVSQRQLAKRAGSTFSTVNGWFREPPALPGVVALAALARRDNLNLNHFLLNEGPPLRGQVVMPKDLEAMLRAHVLAELKRDASPDEARSAIALGGSPLRGLIDRYRDQVKKAREIRKELLEDIAAEDEARRAHHRRNQDTTARWIAADPKHRSPSRLVGRGGSFNLGYEAEKAFLKKRATAKRRTSRKAAR
jgi:transcriptional regulator with XRE-family HTH domain